MNIRTVKYDRLTSEEIAAWSVIQRSDPALYSPFFRPEFTQAVAAVRDNVEVAVLESNGQPVGFFPFERKSWDRGVPVGSRLSDFHGVIASRDVHYDPLELVRSCGLSSWSFDHLVDVRSSFAGFTFQGADSPYIDVSHGFEAYETTRSTGFRSRMRQCRRRVERELGALRLESNPRDPGTFATVVQWKIDQYKRTKALNVLGIAWVHELLEKIREFSGDEFSAVIPALYMDDKLVAATYMLRSHGVLHSWFSAYDRNAARYSPGLLHKMEMLRNAATLGINRVDLGKGVVEYKLAVQSGADTVAEGAVDLSPLTTGARSVWRAVRGGLRATPLRTIAKRPARAVHRFRRWMELK